MSSFKVFSTTSRGSVVDGATISNFELKGAGVKIPAILVGEEGRGRKLGILPVDYPPMAPCPDQGKASSYFSRLATPEQLAGDFSSTENPPTCQQCNTPSTWTTGIRTWDGKISQPEAGEDSFLLSVHPKEGQILGRLFAASLGETKSGNPKLKASAFSNVDTHAIVVIALDGGFRGGVGFTGDRSGGWKCLSPSCQAKGIKGVGDPPAECPECKCQGRSGYGPATLFEKFPGTILMEGNTAEGAAGNAGSHRQIVALVPKGVVFRTTYSGRLYGAPSAHYYLFDGQKILCLTWQERQVADLF